MSIKNTTAQTLQFNYFVGFFGVLKGTLAHNYQLIGFFSRLLHALFLLPQAFSEGLRFKLQWSVSLCGKKNNAQDAGHKIQVKLLLTSQLFF